MSENMVDVEVDIPDDVFMELAKAAHKQNITLNELVNRILKDYIEGKIKLPEDPIEVELREATCAIVKDGVTIETLNRYGVAYNKWYTSDTFNKAASIIIQDGFDLADELQ